MSVLVNRSLLTPADKDFIKSKLLASSNTEPPVTIRPFQVNGDLVHLPLDFYQSLRSLHLKEEDRKENPDWPEFPNDQHVRHPSPAQFTSTLRPYQQEAWEELLPMLKTGRTALVACYTGWGKTCFSAYVMIATGLKTLVLYHVSPLGKSWPTTFQEFTNATCCHIGEEPFNPDAHVYVCSVTRALGPLPFDPLSIGLLIVDEADRFCAPVRIQSFFRFTPKYLLLLTATPEKPNGMGKLLQFYNSYQSIEEPEIKGRVLERFNTRPFRVYKCSTGMRPKIVTTRDRLDWGIVIKSLAPRPDRIELIVQWVLLNPSRKILVLCIQKAQVTDIANALKERGEIATIMMGLSSNYVDARVLLGTMSKLGVGFDDKNTALRWDGIRINTIILAWTVKERSNIAQFIGRARGEDPVIVDLVDDFSSFRKHFQNRQSYYLERNGQVIDAPQPISF